MIGEKVNDMTCTLAIDLLITIPVDGPGPVDVRGGSSDCGKVNDTLAIDLLITDPEEDGPGLGSSDWGKGK